MAAALLLALWLAPAAARNAPVDGPAAREQVRACMAVGTPAEDALAACRKALELGVNRDWAGSIRLLMARKLIERQRWDDAVSVYRELAAAQPAEAQAHARLGHALLYGKGDAEAALSALREAVRLDPRDVSARAALAAAWNALGRHEEAKQACDELSREAGSPLQNRPGAAAICAAAAQRAVWPAAPRASETVAPEERPERR
jgi:tetratricopeptide (TPR) repeat protein